MIAKNTIDIQKDDIYGKKVIPTFTYISTKTKIAIFVEGFSQVGHL